jgi:hypothetical protein
MSRLTLPALFVFLLLVTPSHAGAQLVSESPGGLIYQTYANEGQTNAINTVPDFSRSGYQGGGVAIPFVPAKITLTPSGGDDTRTIQDAIDAVSALPPGADGFRGAVLLTEGEYTVSSSLHITTSGVVIRGAGQQDGGGTRITYTATTQSNLFNLSGAAGPTATGSAYAITDPVVPVGSRILHVTSASTFAPGDLVVITNLMNQQWIDDIGMHASGVMGAEAWRPSGYQLQHFRYIESIHGNALTLDAPLVQMIENRYGGGTVRKATWTGALEQVGIENLRMESSFASDTDENHGWYAITMQRVRHGWVRQVTSRHFGQGLVSITNRCKFVTVEDCAHLDPKSTTAGGRRYSFNIDDSSYILFQRCLTRQGRHDYVSGSLTPGPNAFVDSLATEPINDIGPHHRYATGQVYDNIKAEENPAVTNDAIRVQNRTTSGSGHGWSGAQIMFWNCEAPEFVCDAPVGAMNWAVGNVGVQAESTRSPGEPFGIWESHHHPVLPRSLYYAQLRDRLGANAVNKVTLPAQDTGAVWSQLKDWDGDGLFLDPLIVRLDAEVEPDVGVPVSLRAQVRHLRVLDGLNSVSWKKISGPGTVVFADRGALETTATFDQPGSYVLEVEVGGGGSSHVATATVRIGEGGGTTPPAAPTGLKALHDPGMIRLAWDESAETPPLTHRVYRRTPSGDYGDPLVGDLPVHHYLDTTVAPQMTYLYVVTAVDALGNESSPSAELAIATAGAVTAFEFGTVPGKVTASAAGFSLSSSGSSAFSDRADGLEAVAATTAGFENLAFLRRFFGLGGGQSNDFTLTAEVRVNELIGTAQENNDRWGIQMFASAGNEASGSDGISAQILARGNTGSGTPEGALIGLRLGLNGAFLVSANWVGGAVLPGDAFRLRVGGTFVSGSELSLAFTVSHLDGSDSQTIQTLVSGAVLAGDLFGGGLRLKNGRAIEYKSFSVARVPVDADADHLPDHWERFFFGGIDAINGGADSDRDGVPDFFEYLYGSSPVDPAERGFRFEAAQSGDGGAVVFTWQVKEGFVLDTDYRVRISTSLDRWDPQPPEHALWSETIEDGRATVVLTVTHDHGARLFISLSAP